MENIAKTLPSRLTERLKNYLHSHEKILDFMKEVWVPRYDISWIILTNERVIVATRKIFEYKFVDYALKNLDIDLTLGFPFDTIMLEAVGKKYTGHFYSFRRGKNLEFFEQIEKKLEEREGTTKEKKEEKEEYPPVETLKELADLKEQGIITEEEFNKKKKELLEKL